MIDLGVNGIILTITKKGLFFLDYRKFGSPEIMVLYSPLHAFWSNSGLHPPKRTHFQDHILMLHTVGPGRVCLVG
jgi:hypothetical protein